MGSRILGVDLGLRRVGLALSDEMGLLAHPLPTKTVRGTRSIIQAIKKAVEEWQVGTVVIGLPLTTQGEIGERAEQTLEIVEKLDEQLSVPVEVWDERLTTAQAQRQLFDLDGKTRADAKRGRRRRREKGVTDAMAATIILQAFLDRKRQSDQI